MGHCIQLLEVENARLLEDAQPSVHILFLHYLNMAQHYFPLIQPVELMYAQILQGL